MWTARQQPLGTPSTLHFTVLADEANRAGPLSFDEAVVLWQESAAFREFFGGLLAAAPFEAFFWELPPVDRRRRDRPFEFVLVDAPVLARMRPEPGVFAEHFRGGRPVATFPNLGGDAWLVAPAGGGDERAYAHLAVFQREAADAERHAFWQAVGRLVEEWTEGRPRWLSTSGLGVAWLHVRWDTVPKYYQHRPYREER